MLAREEDKEIGIPTKHENRANTRGKGSKGKGVKDGRNDRRKREELKLIEKMYIIKPPNDDTKKQIPTKK